MSEYEDLIGILVKKSKVSREEIEKLIALKKEKIGAGYLTNQGALFLIASDLGILLTKEVEKKNPMEEIKVVKISQEDLDKKSKALKSDKRRRKIKYNMMSPLLLLGIFGGVFVFTREGGHPMRHVTLLLALFLFAPVADLAGQEVVPGVRVRIKAPSISERQLKGHIVHADIDGIMIQK